MYTKASEISQHNLPYTYQSTSSYQVFKQTFSYTTDNASPGVRYVYADKYSNSIVRSYSPVYDVMWFTIGY